MASTSCTPRTARRQSTARGFLPTSPLRGRTENAVKEGAKRKFLSTSPLRGTTANVTENTVYFPAHLSQQDTAYKNTLRFCAVCGHFRGASARSALKMHVLPGANRPAFFCALRVRTGFSCAAGAFTPAKYRPAPIAARGRHVRPWFCTGCLAGKSAGCPLPGR